MGSVLIFDEFFAFVLWHDYTSMNFEQEANECKVHIIAHIAYATLYVDKYKNMAESY